MEDPCKGFGAGQAESPQFFSEAASFAVPASQVAPLLHLLMGLGLGSLKSAFLEIHLFILLMQLLLTCRQSWDIPVHTRYSLLLLVSWVSDEGDEKESGTFRRVLSSYPGRGARVLPFF